MGRSGAAFDSILFSHQKKSHSVASSPGAGSRGGEISTPVSNSSSSLAGFL